MESNPRPKLGTLQPDFHDSTDVAESPHISLYLRMADSAAAVRMHGSNRQSSSRNNCHGRDDHR
jgi:hypothetical protein